LLRTRIITALVVLPVVLIALFLFPAWAWTIFAMMIVGLSFWEWSRFGGWSAKVARLYWLASTMVAALMAYAALQSATFNAVASPVLMGVAGVFWAIAVPAWLLRAWRPVAPLWVAVAGWLVIYPFGWALVQLRERGAVVLLGFAVVVWVADIAAYFAGKKFGKHKLAPAISPGKTWEGVVGAMLGVTALWSALFWTVSTWFSWPASLDIRVTFFPGLLVYLGLTAISIFGDLFESWMKRGAGLKDSSNLLPGHGGVLDRVDALTSTLPVACALLILLK
jgi:phosphatidate cytidylyltransferase